MTKPNWPEMKFLVSQDTEKGESVEIVIRPDDSIGAAYRRTTWTGNNGSRLERLPPEEQLPWLQLYYLKLVGEMLFETDSGVRELLELVQTILGRFARLLFWKPRGLPWTESQKRS